MCEAKRIGMSVGNCDVSNCSGNFCSRFNIDLLEVKAANTRRQRFEDVQPGGLVVDKFYKKVEVAAVMKGMAPRR